MRVVVRSTINPKLTAAKIGNDRGLWTFSATEWHRLISPFTPMKTGKLRDSGIPTFKKITYTAPYAKRMYYGYFNFSKAANKLATRMWDKAARPTQASKLVSSMQRYIETRGLLK